MTDTRTIDEAPARTPGAAPLDRPNMTEVGHGVGQFVTKTKQTLAAVAEEIYGNSDPETLHHLWDWNRNNIPSPGAGSTVPSGVSLRIARPGDTSGGPTAQSLSNGLLTDMSAAREVPSEAPIHTPGADRAITRDMTPTGSHANARSTVDEGSDGAEAQARQDAADVTNDGEGGTGGKVAGGAAAAAARLKAAKAGTGGADADFTE